jgi:hypothetical protein
VHFSLSLSLLVPCISNSLSLSLLLILARPHVALHQFPSENAIIQCWVTDSLLISYGYFVTSCSKIFAYAYHPCNNAMPVASKCITLIVKALLVRAFILCFTLFTFVFVRAFILCFTLSYLSGSLRSPKFMCICCQILIQMSTSFSRGVSSWCFLPLLHFVKCVEYNANTNGAFVRDSMSPSSL